MHRQEVTAAAAPSPGGGPARLRERGFRNDGPDSTRDWSGADASSGGDGKLSRVHTTVPLKPGQSP